MPLRGTSPREYSMPAGFVNARSQGLGGYSLGSPRKHCADSMLSLLRYTRTAPSFVGLDSGSTRKRIDKEAATRTGRSEVHR